MKLGKLQIEILKLLKQYGALQICEIANLLKQPPSKVRKSIRGLRSRGLIDFVHIRKYYLDGGYLYTTAYYLPFWVEKRLGL